MKVMTVRPAVASENETLRRVVNKGNDWHRSRVLTAEVTIVPGGDVRLLWQEKPLRREPPSFVEDESSLDLLPCV